MTAAPEPAADPAAGGLSPAPPPHPERRQVLRLGGLALATLAVAACGGDDGDGGSAGTAAADAPTTTAGSAGSDAATATTTAEDDGGTTDQATPAALTAADFEGLGVCALLPEKTAGPFPLDEQFDRRDITEGLDGHPLRVGLRVVDGECIPVPGAQVEIWHCDATGDYSAFVDNGGGKDDGPGTTFLRGTQTAGDDGIVEFQTIYPGWYRGRAVHIHLRVHRDGETVLTSQLFFDDAYSEDVFTAAPYAEFGPPDTTNASDGIAGDPAGEGTLLALTPAETARGAGTLALVNLGVDA